MNVLYNIVMWYKVDKLKFRNIYFGKRNKCNRESSLYFRQRGIGVKKVLSYLCFDRLTMKSRIFAIIL